MITLLVQRIQATVAPGRRANGAKKSDLGITIQMQHAQGQVSIGLLQVDGVPSRRHSNVGIIIIIKQVVKPYQVVYGNHPTAIR